MVKNNYDKPLLYDHLPIIQHYFGNTTFKVSYQQMNEMLLKSGYIKISGDIMIDKT